MRTPVRFELHSKWLVEVCIVVALAGVTWAGLWMVTHGGRRVAFDSFRDMAWAENISEGRVWSDPTLQHEEFWYAPGNPLLFGSLARLIGVSVSDVYRSSALWWNGLLPILLYILVRLSANRLTALLAVPLVGLGSLWWLTHFAVPIPSIQGTLLNLCCLIFVQRFALIDADKIPKVATPPLQFGAVLGVLLAASAWYHPVCATLVAGAVGLQIVYGSLKPTETDGGNSRTRVGISHQLPVASGDAPRPSGRIPYWVRRLAVLARKPGEICGLGPSRSEWRIFAVGAFVSASLLSLPLFLHLVLLPKRNLAPLRYFANELSDPNFALQLYVPSVPILAVVGMWFIIRNHPRVIWVVGYLLVGVVGQAAGYLNHFLGVRIPYLLPHEFQWHTQLAVGVCAAVGISGIVLHLVQRVPWPTEKWVAQFLWVGLLFVAALSPALPYVKFAGSYLVEVTDLSKLRRDTTTWIRGNTSIEEVFACQPLEAYLVVAGLTGRKCVAVPIGHMNPSVNAAKRLSDLDTMLVTQNEEEFSRFAAQYGVNYLMMNSRSAVETDRLRLLFSWRSLTPEFKSSAEQVVIFKIISTDD